MKLFKEFQEFAARGNVIDLAVGIIIGGAFGKIVSSLVNDIIMPPIAILIAGVNFTQQKIVLQPGYTDSAGKVVNEIAIAYGSFIQEVFNFIIIAFAIFMLIKFINALRKEEQKKESKPTDPKDITLLAEIRDLLKKQTKLK